MLIIGLTGSLATGKSSVAGIFRRKGAKVIDADRLAHRLLEPRGACYASVIRVFGKDILKGKRIDRKKLAGAVFNSKRKLKQLEAIVHPRVGQLIKEELKRYKNRAKIVVLEVPLLFEAGLDRLADCVVVVKANQAIQLRRATRKLGISRAEALRRIKAQMPLRTKIRLADFIIDNNGTKNQTEKQVNALWQKL
ncbi:MAG TPA: dephospho-CoA kinase [Candidatus Omnitrophota bacterium]|nr:dephospho-CoA kinase [Candidatus Omnitrophota bacterium]